MKHCYLNVPILIFLILNIAHAQWKDLNIPKRAIVNDIIHVGDRICIGTSEGIFINEYATEEQFHWKNLSTGLQTTFINAMTSVDSNIVVSTSLGIFIGQGFGKRWVSASSDITATMVHEFALDYETWVYAATSNGIWRSKDKGDHWILMGLEGLNVLTVTILGDQSGYLAGTSVSDGGRVFFGNLLGNKPTELAALNDNILAVREYGLKSILVGCYSHNPFDDNLRRIDLNQPSNINYNGFPNSAISCIGFKGTDFSFIGIQARGQWGGAEIPEGIFLSRDLFIKPDKPSWINWNDGLTTLSIESMYMTADHIFIGTDEGVFIRNFTELTGIKPSAKPIEEAIQFDMRHSHINFPHQLIGSSFSIIGMDGKCLIRNQKVNSEKQSVNLISKGIFFLNVYTGDKKLVKKLIN